MATIKVRNARSAKPGKMRIPSIFLGFVLAVLIASSLAQTARGNDDIRDLPFVLDAVNDALETARTNVKVPWKNPATGNSGLIIVEKTLYPTSEMPCRQYRRTYSQPGKGEMMTRGTGCRVGPARWKIEEERTASQVPKATKSGPSSGATAGSTASPPSPVGGTPGTTTRSRPRAPQKGTPSKTVKRPVKTPPKSSSAAKAKPKPAAPSLPKFTMPSKAEI